MYNYVELCTTMYNYVQLCTTMYNYVQLCLTMYNYVQLCTTMYNYVQLCTTMYNGVSAKFIARLKVDTKRVHIVPMTRCFFQSGRASVQKKYT